MSNLVEDIRKKSDFDEKDCFFLDTNVWLYIYYGIYSERDRYFKKWYTDAFEKMLLCNCKIFVDFLVLSEFVNRFARLEYDRKMPPIKREPNRNNLIYVELCKEKKFTFVTHDGDFSNHDIRVLTANNAMLSR